MSNYIKKHNDYLIVVRTVLVAALTNYNELETKDKNALSEFNDFFIKLSKYYENKRRIKETIYDGLLESSNILNKIKKYKTDFMMLIDKNDYIIYKINKKKEDYISEIMEYINKIKEYFAKYQMTGGTGGEGVGEGEAEKLVTYVLDTSLSDGDAKSVVDMDTTKDEGVDDFMVYDDVILQIKSEITEQIIQDSLYKQILQIYNKLKNEFDKIDNSTESNKDIKKQMLFVDEINKKIKSTKKSYDVSIQNYNLYKEQYINEKNIEKKIKLIDNLNLEYNDSKTELIIMTALQKILNDKITIKSLINLSKIEKGYLVRKQYNPELQPRLQRVRKRFGKKKEIVELIEEIKPTINKSSYNKIELQQLPTNELHKMLLDLIQYYNKLKLLDDELHAI
jgi:hypothetical protein